LLLLRPAALEAKIKFLMSSYALSSAFLASLAKNKSSSRKGFLEIKTKTVRLLKRA